MCRAHWAQVPGAIQHAVYGAYRPGQTATMRPSPGWHLAAAAAIGYVALLEGHGLTKNEVSALVRFGYEETIVTKYVEKMGEERRGAILKVLEGLRAELAVRVKNEPNGEAAR